MGAGSNGALHGVTTFNMDEAPSNEFFLEYVARPQTAEIFFEEVLMACVFYGMPILIENNKPRLLYIILRTEDTEDSVQTDLTSHTISYQKQKRIRWHT